MSKPFRISTRHVDDGWMDAWLKADGRSLYATTSLSSSLSFSFDFASRIEILPFVFLPEQKEERILCELVYNKPVVNSPRVRDYSNCCTVSLTEHEVRNLCFRPIRFNSTSAVFLDPRFYRAANFPLPLSWQSLVVWNV